MRFIGYLLLCVLQVLPPASGGSTKDYIVGLLTLAIGVLIWCFLFKKIDDRAHWNAFPKSVLLASCAFLGVLAVFCLLSIAGEMLIVGIL